MSVTDGRGSARTMSSTPDLSRLEIGLIERRPEKNKDRRGESPPPKVRGPDYLSSDPNEITEREVKEELVFAIDTALREIKETRRFAQTPQQMCIQLTRMYVEMFAQIGLMPRDGGPTDVRLIKAKLDEFMDSEEIELTTDVVQGALAALPVSLRPKPDQPSSDSMAVGAAFSDLRPGATYQALGSIGAKIYDYLQFVKGSVVSRRNIPALMVATVAVPFWLSGAVSMATLAPILAQTLLTANQGPDISKPLNTFRRVQGNAPLWAETWDSSTTRGIGRFWNFLHDTTGLGHRLDDATVRAVIAINEQQPLDGKTRSLLERSSTALAANAALLSPFRLAAIAGTMVAAGVYLDYNYRYDPARKRAWFEKQRRGYPDLPAVTGEVDLRLGFYFGQNTTQATRIKTKLSQLNDEWKAATLTWSRSNSGSPSEEQIDFLNEKIINYYGFFDNVRATYCILQLPESYPPPGKLEPPAVLPLVQTMAMQRAKLQGLASADNRGKQCLARLFALLEKYVQADFSALQGGVVTQINPFDIKLNQLNGILPQGNAPLRDGEAMKVVAIVEIMAAAADRVDEAGNLPMGYADRMVAIYTALAGTHATGASATTFLPDALSSPMNPVDDLPPFKDWPLETPAERRLRQQQEAEKQQEREKEAYEAKKGTFEKLYERAEISKLLDELARAGGRRGIKDFAAEDTNYVKQVANDLLPRMATALNIVATNAAERRQTVEDYDRLTAEYKQAVKELQRLAIKYRAKKVTGEEFPVPVPPAAPAAQNAPGGVQPPGRGRGEARGAAQGDAASQDLANMGPLRAVAAVSLTDELCNLAALRLVKL